MLSVSFHFASAIQPSNLLPNLFFASKHIKQTSAERVLDYEPYRKALSNLTTAEMKISLVDKAC